MERTEPVNVEQLRTPDPACDDFVRGKQEGRLCFLPAWSRMVEQAVGLKSYYLVAREGGAVRGVLPLVHVRSLLFGNRMVSQAFVDYGGPLADGPDAVGNLFQSAVRLATDLGCESIEFRNIAPMPYDLVGRADKVSMWLALTADPEELWKRFDPKVRNHVRKAEKSNLVAAGGGLDLLDDFYAVYTARMRQLGTPCYSRRLMRGILETFPENSRILAVRQGDRTVGAGITTHFGNFAEMLYASMLTEYNNLCPNNLLYWEAIKHYCLRGVKWFDFGRSTVDSGTHRFKKQWGPDRVDLHYQYWVRPGREFSETTPDNPRYRRKVEMWRRLPLCLTRWLGPRISRGLP